LLAHLIIATTSINSYNPRDLHQHTLERFLHPDHPTDLSITQTYTNKSPAQNKPHPSQTTMETTHRKIELQSPLDLLYLHANASTLLRSKLDLHFPPSAAPASASDDVLKSRVEELSTVWLDKVYQDVKANLNINGLEGKEMEEAMVMAEGKGEGEFDSVASAYQIRRKLCG
jgi:hypothetical protein